MYEREPEAEPWSAAFSVVVTTLGGVGAAILILALVGLYAVVRYGLTGWP